MELETEELLQRWLKIQIRQHQFSLIYKILMFIIILFSFYYSYVYLLPSLKKQIESTQKIMENISKVSETTQQQEDLFKGLQDQLQILR